MVQVCDRVEMDKIYTDDCIPFMTERMESDSVKLTITSPPYDNLRNYDGYHFDFEGTADALYRVTGGGASSFGLLATR